MIIDKADVSVIRLCEERGMFPADAELARFGLNRDEYARRLRDLAAQQVIRRLSPVLVVPPLLKGDWVWATVLANAARPLGVANMLCRKLPFVTEVIINSGMPENVGPNLALLFYSRDFGTEAKFIRSAAGMEHHEVYRIAEYSFPVSMPLSSPEKELLRFLVRNPDVGLEGLAEKTGRKHDWLQAKLDRLLWTETNRSGVLRIQPEVDWTRVDNFGHFHFVLLTGHRSDQLGQLVAERGFELVFKGQHYRERYVQVEADVWGIADLMDRVAWLNRLGGVRVAGVTWNEKLTVHTDWMSGLLD